MEETAQVNLEYLLIIVGAVAVVTIVSLYIKSVANTVTQRLRRMIRGRSCKIFLECRFVLGEKPVSIGGGVGRGTCAG